MVANLVLPRRVNGYLRRKIVLSNNDNNNEHFDEVKLLMTHSFLFFLLRWHFYPTTNVFLSMLYFYILKGKRNAYSLWLLFVSKMY